jgi:hypothetical protein
MLVTRFGGLLCVDCVYTAAPACSVEAKHVHEMPLVLARVVSKGTASAVSVPKALLGSQADQASRICIRS